MNVQHRTSNVEHLIGKKDEEQIKKLRKTQRWLKFMLNVRRA
ncbi:MAG: hypothetical protein ACMUIP_08475 [bacterium]